MANAVFAKTLVNSQYSTWLIAGSWGCTQNTVKKTERQNSIQLVQKMLWGAQIHGHMGMMIAPVAYKSRERRENVVKYLNKKKKEYYYPAAFLIWSSFNGC
jgi:hypothetical protein